MDLPYRGNKRGIARNGCREADRSGLGQGRGRQARKVAGRRHARNTALELAQAQSFQRGRLESLSSRALKVWLRSGNEMEVSSGVVALAGKCLRLRLAGGQHY